MQCGMRALTTSATILAYFASVDLAAAAWTEAFKMSGKTSGV